MNTETIVNSWASAQKSGALLPCPRCGNMRMYSNLYENALSRRCNLHICPSCGSQETLEDYHRVESSKLPLAGWFLFKTVFGQPYEEKQEDGNYSFDTMQPVTVTAKDVETILVTALEGHAVLAWCGSIELEDPLGDYVSEHVARGGEATIITVDGDKVYLNAAKLVHGLHQWFLEGHDTSGAVNNGEIDTSEIDDETADAILQYAVFGELVYG